MQSHNPTTPFGRRSLTLAHVATQMAASARPPDKVVHKWKVFKAVCVARPRIGVSERALAVLNALISFYPDTTLTGEDDLIVFPSNELLLPKNARHAGVDLAAAIGGAGGRRVDRSTGQPQRQALRPKGQGRGDQARLWFRPRAAGGPRRGVRRNGARDRGRDSSDQTCKGEDHALPPRHRKNDRYRHRGRRSHEQGRAGARKLAGVHAVFRGLVEGVSRTASREELESTADALSVFADDVLNLLENQIKTTNTSANESPDERHKQNSNPNSPIELEPSLREGRAARAEPNPRTSATERTYPLGMVLSACPDIVDYAKGGIANWRDFLATAAVVRPMLGISPSAWEEARTVMGEAEAAVVVACLLQRSSTIQSAGGYLRELTRKAGEGEFSLGPILMAQINAKNRERRSA